MMRFPKPWKLEQVDPGPTYSLLVTDANGVKLFYISADDNPDGEGEPGAEDGPTVYGYHADETALMGELKLMFEVL